MNFLTFAANEHTFYPLRNAEKIRVQKTRTFSGEICTLI